MSGSSIRPSRRALVKGAAWSVPVVAMTSKVSAADVVCSPGNTSPECDPIIVIPPSGAGDACKFSGGSCDSGEFKKAYRFTFCFKNTTDRQIVVKINEISAAGRTNRPPKYRPSVTVPAKTTICEHIFVLGNGNSQNGQACLTYSFEYLDAEGKKQNGGGKVCTGVLDLNPCDDCSTTYGRAGARIVQEPTTPAQPGDDAATTAGPTG